MKFRRVFDTFLFTLSFRTDVQIMKGKFLICSEIIFFI